MGWKIEDWSDGVDAEKVGEGGGLVLATVPE